MNSSATLTPEQIVATMRHPGTASVYLLGCFDRRVTLHSQQVRALNLVYATHSLDLVKGSSAVAVVGGGVAGLTAALALRRLGVPVTLYERRPLLLHLLRGCHSRWLHPNIYDWPEPGSGEVATRLPLMNWTAGRASDVADQLMKEWESSRDAGLAVFQGAKISLPASGKGRIRVICNTPYYHDQQFDAVILAVGFGVEQPMNGLPMRSYWRDDAIHQPELVSDISVARYLVSGNGDGGLIDVLRLRISDFTHERIGDLVPETVVGPLRAAILDIEAQARTLLAKDEGEANQYMFDAYRRISVPEIDDLLRRRLRQDTHVTLNFRDHPLTLGSSTLHRLLVTRLTVIDPHGLLLERGELKHIEGTEPAFSVRFGDDPSAHRFHRVVVRHGPLPSLDRDFPEIFRDSRVAMKALALLDLTRTPMWPENYFDRKNSGGGDTSSGPSIPPGGTAQDVAPADSLTVSPEAKHLVDALLARRDENISAKLSLLTVGDKRFVLRRLAEKALETRAGLGSLMDVASCVPEEEQLISVLVGQIAYQTLFAGSVENKAKVLGSGLLAIVPLNIVEPYFLDVFSIVNRDTYPEVNIVVPALVSAQRAIPTSLVGAYLETLLKQTQSSATRGAPAARQALKEMPEAMSREALKAIGVRYLVSTFGTPRTHLTDFIKSRIELAPEASKQMFSDFVELPYRSFVRKYDDSPEPYDNDPSRVCTPETFTGDLEFCKANLVPGALRPIRISAYERMEGHHSHRHWASFSALLENQWNAPSGADALDRTRCLKLWMFAQEWERAETLLANWIQDASDRKTEIQGAFHNYFFEFIRARTSDAIRMFVEKLLGNPPPSDVAARSLILLLSWSVTRSNVPAPEPSDWPVLKRLVESGPDVARFPELSVIGKALNEQ